MDRGFYLYCVREKTNSEFSVPGIDGGKIWTLPYQDLEAIISEVSLEKFASEEIKKNAQEDLNWIKEKAQIHEEVIEQAMGKVWEKPSSRASLIRDKLIPVIPMQFGVIFKTKERIEEVLGNRYQNFKKSLENLKGKQEWGVKVFLKEGTFREVIESQNKTVLAQKKEIESMPKGVAFFAQKEIEEMINQEKDKELDRITEEIYECLGHLAFSKNKDKLLEKDFTGKIEEMVLNAFYLIEEPKLDQFQKKVEELKEKYSSQGFGIEMTGPWPSYHFA